MIARASLAHDSVKHQVKHFAYAAGWKKFERAWNFVIRVRQLQHMTPVLEGVLSKVTRKGWGVRHEDPDATMSAMPRC
jgi:hypothetical protein